MSQSGGNGHPVSNLPHSLSSVIGREQQVAELKALLETNRLVTLTGPGGAGKTRLACHAAAEMVRRFENRVWLVELADVQNPALIAQAAAAAVGVPEAPGPQMLKTLTAHLQGQKSLLILDNCEHLADACARSVHALLSACPRLCILATSREALHLSGEMVYPTPCLTIPHGAHPEPADRLISYEAVQLFVDRARSALPTFRVTEANAAAIAQVCRRLDGIPLAIELAAARVKVLTVEQIAGRLEHSLGLLRGQDPLASPRHQTVLGALDWSFQLLPEPERILWRRLAVFAGSFSLEAVEAICAGGLIDPASLLDLLSQLVERSLVTVQESHGAMYYRLLEPVRQFGLAKLEECGESETYQRRHRDWHLQWAEEAQVRLTGPEQAAWLTRLALTYPNFAAALQWSSTRGEAVETMRLAVALYHFWWIRGRRNEGRQWLETALEKTSEPTMLRGLAHEQAGSLAKEQGDYRQATAHCEASLAICRKLGDERGIAGTLNILGTIEMHLGKFDKAQALFEESQELARKHGDQRSMAFAVGNLGMIALQLGAYDRAQSWFEAGLAIFREQGNLAKIAAALNNLGLVAVARGDLDTAWAMHEQSLILRRQLEARHEIAQSLFNLGLVALQRGELKRAEQLFEETMVLVQQLSDRMGMGLAWHGLGYVARRKGEYERCTTLLRESLQVWRTLPNKGRLADCLDEMARLAVAQGCNKRGARLLGAVASLREAARTHQSPFERDEHERCAAAAREGLGDRGFCHAFEEGRVLTLDAAIAYGLDERTLPDPDRPAARLDRLPANLTDSGLAPAGALTDRETEIARLVAQGLTRNEIGRRLHLSPRTVQKHEENIRSKLGLPNRTSLAAWAVRHGLSGESGTH